MFKKVLIVADMDFINIGFRSHLEKLGIEEIENVQYCDEALLKLNTAKLNNAPFDLLISDLSCYQDHNQQKTKPGTQLIKSVRNKFPDLKIVVFSVENKRCTIKSLFNNYRINAYVWKNRDGLRELIKALMTIDRSDAIYISPKLGSVLSKNNAIEITDYDVFLIDCLAQGMLQGQISKKLKSLKRTPSSVSAVEKKLKFLKEHFNANNPAHLVALSKDLGLI